MKFLIWSNEHEGWWGPNKRGYVGQIEQAGRYDRDVADRIVQNANQFLPKGRFNEVAMPDPFAPATEIKAVEPVAYKGSPLEGLLKRAGGLITCAFHTYTVRSNSTLTWRNILIFEDGDNQRFAYAFELDQIASMALVEQITNGVKTMWINGDNIGAPK